MTLRPTISLLESEASVMATAGLAARRSAAESNYIGQAERVEALTQTGLLDTPPEESFDRLTRLAAKLIGVPATFISLVDERRDFYKSCFGFGEPLASARQLAGRNLCNMRHG